MKKIAQWGAMPSPNVLMSHGKPDLKKVVDSAGQNLGNLAIGYYTFEQFNNIEYVKHSVPAEQVNDEYDLLLVAAANFINPSSDLSRWADYLEKINLPVVCIGLGAQAPSYVKKLNIKPGTQRFISVLAEKCSSIGVRGEYTAQLLNGWGVSNVEPLGCPSAYFKSGFPISAPKLDKSNIESLVFNGTHLNRSLIKQGLKLSGEIPAEYVAQDEYDFIPYLKHLAFDKEACKGELKDSDFAGLKVSYYGDVPDWSKDVSKAGFGFGSRMHGNMISFKAGVPTVWIQVDSRTRELCEYLGLPSVTSREFFKMRSIEEMYEVYENSNFDQAYKGNVEKYISHLKKAGLKENFSFDEKAGLKENFAFKKKEKVSLFSRLFGNY